MLEQIIDLIALKQEGAYWDFKQQWYSKENNSDMLHDIICMANNMENRDSYIIIGIDDKNKSVLGVSKDKNRKTTQNLVDFMRDKKFAGGIRPIVYVETIKIEDNLVDVIVIQNSLNTPFYLTQGYKDVQANSIYTRVMDSNTPINATADINNVEYLWKKRFRLLETPLDKIKYYLSKKDLWIAAPEENGPYKMYYKYFPEYVISRDIDEDKDRYAYAYYLLTQVDITPRWAKIEIFYHQTLLEYFQGVYVDGGRYFTPTPDFDVITTVDGEEITIRSFEKDSLLYKVHEFYFDSTNEEAVHAHNNFEDSLVIFNSLQEKEKFFEYVKLMWAEKKKKNHKFKDIYLSNALSKKEARVLKQRYADAQILRAMLEEYRASCEKGNMRIEQ